MEMWLYVWQCRNCRMLKVGRSRAPWQRGKTHGRTRHNEAIDGCATFEWRLLYMRQLSARDNPVVAERTLRHACARLAKYREGEWMQPTMALLRYIAQLRQDENTVMQPLPHWQNDKKLTSTDRVKAHLARTFYKREDGVLCRRSNGMPFGQSLRRSS